MPERRATEKAASGTGVVSRSAGALEEGKRGRRTRQKNSNCQWCGAPAKDNEVIRVSTPAGWRRLCGNCRQMPMKLYDVLANMSLSRVMTLALKHIKGNQ